MWPGRNYKESFRYAIVGTCLVAVYLLMTIRPEGDGVIDDKVDKILSIVSVIVLTILLSLEWVRFVKQYVDFAIEEKLKDRKIVEIAIQEKIKKLEEKEQENG